MTNENLDIIPYIAAYLDDEINDAELIYLNDWLEKNPLNKVYFNEIVTIYFNTNIQKSPITAQESLQNLVKKRKPKRVLGFVGYQKWTIAASVAFLLGIWFYFYVQKDKTQFNSIVYVKKAIKDSLQLNDGTLLYSNGPGSINIDEKYGTGNRLVQQLIGKIYYQVKPDDTKPFIINTINGDVKVIGTSFVIEINQKEIELIVKEGKVKVYNNLDTIILTSNERVSLHNNSRLYKYRNKDVNYLFWKNNVLVYNNIPLKLALKDLERKYGYTIIVNKAYENKLLNGRFYAKDFFKVIQSISETFGLQYSVQNKVVNIDN